MTNTYYTTHTQRHWYEWPFVVVASAILWIALGLFLVVWDIGERILGE